MTEILFPQMPVTRKDGSAPFVDGTTTLDFNLLSFWQWSASDLISNALRGRLAEFLVAQSLGIISDTNPLRAEWDSVDLHYEELRIEVKSAAYLQTWAQKRLSPINFDIAPTRHWNSASTELAKESLRQANLYVFALLRHDDPLTLNAMDMSHWIFYLLPTAVLDEELPRQKQLSLAKLLTLKPQKCEFKELGAFIKQQKTKWLANREIASPT